jgi:hypothetical protein
MIARAAYSVGTPLWEGTIADELRGQQQLARQETGEDPTAAPGLPQPVEGADTR